MHKLWIGLGRLAYWLAYPGLIIVIPFTQRARVLLTNGDRVLVVHGWLSDGRWQLPGGGIKRGESPAAAAGREVHEETGLEIPAELLTDARPMRFREGLRSFPYQLFVVQMAEAASPKGRWPEIVECAWVPRAELNNTNASRDVLDAIVIP